MTIEKVRHPAKYSDVLFPTFLDLLCGSTRILDPMAGTGRIFNLQPYMPHAEIEGTEIEPEWKALDSRITLGNALALPFEDGYFDAICVSPVYGNRMSDHHEAKDASRRNTYRHCLGRPLHPDNSGAMKWGDNYRQFHIKAWAEAVRVLRKHGRFVLNVSDYMIKGVCQPVTDFHVGVLEGLGLEAIEHWQIETPRQRFGQNGHLRVDYESVILFRLGGSK